MRFSIPLFRLFGIQVYLDWTWVLYGIIRFTLLDRGNYHNKLYVALEFLVVFGIVLLHEFGHALACKSVGGRAERIVLWPLGGIAYVDPPFRPGAMLWSIVAGPLVNVVLIPITIAVAIAVGMTTAALNGGAVSESDLQRFVTWIAIFNVLNLIINLLPVYPLDGGKILWALLWFIIGPFTSLKIVSVIGIVCSVVILFASLFFQQYFLAVMAFFLATQAVSGWRFANAMAAQQAAYDERMR